MRLASVMSMRSRGFGLVVLLALGGCNAPDYSPVRDWAATASLAVDYPAASGGTAAQPPGSGTTTPPRFLDLSVLAMQEALAIYLQSLATLASDGVLGYPENPFVDLAAVVTPTSPSGGQAITALGRQLRHSTRTNAQAPALRDNIVEADPQVQALIAALRGAVARQTEEEAASRQRAAAYYAGTAAASRDPAARQALAEWADRRDAGFVAEAQARAQYLDILQRIAADHARMKAQAGSITREQAVREIRIAEDQLRRASVALQRGARG